MKAFRLWSGCFPSLMNCCWTGTKAAHGTITKKQFQLPVWNLDGHRMKKLKTCMAYILHEERQLGCPSHEYFDLLADGYTEWGFPTDTLHSGLSSSIGKAAAVEFLKEID